MMWNTFFWNIIPLCRRCLGRVFFFQVSVSLWLFEKRVQCQIGNVILIALKWSARCCFLCVSFIVFILINMMRLFPKWILPCAVNQISGVSLMSLKRKRSAIFHWIRFCWNQFRDCFTTNSLLIVRYSSVLTFIIYILLYGDNYPSCMRVAIPFTKRCLKLTRGNISGVSSLVEGVELLNYVIILKSLNN